MGGGWAELARFNSRQDRCLGERYALWMLSFALDASRAIIGSDPRVDGPSASFGSANFSK
jgi:hypothetical protein